ncbi:MAG: endonuclease [Moraxellaceae bacterium]|nr:MAG: endonuclease [Moraxellaceae bacterium]
MSIGVAIFIGIIIGGLVTYFILSSHRNSTVIAEYEHKIQQLQLEQQEAIQRAVKKSLNTSRATIKGRVAEQFAPLLPEFEYLPSDAKFLGDPVDYVIFDGYTDWRDGNLPSEAIEVILMDIKSGQARLSKGQLAIAEAIKQGRVRFETLRIDTPDSDRLDDKPTPDLSNHQPDGYSKSYFDFDSDKTMQK